MKILFIVFLLLLNLSFSIRCLGSQPIKLTDKNQAILFKGKYVDYLEDTSNRLAIKDIISPSYDQKFNIGTGEVIVTNSNFNASYWLRIRILNETNKTEVFAAELYDFRINYYEIYVLHNNRFILTDSGGSDQPFYQKKYIHKNFINNLSLKPHSSATLYYKIKSTHSVSFLGMVRTFERLIQYSNSEYFLLALFYGAIISLAMYNMFIFISVWDRTYLYYVFYVLSVGFYSLSQDGLGYQYMWSDFPWINNYMFPVAGYFIILWVLLYSKRFLNLKKTAPFFNKLLLPLILLRTLVLIITLLEFPVITRWLDLFILLFVYVAGVSSWFLGNRVARFFVTAFSIFFLGYLFTFLLLFNLITSSAWVIYSFNIGVVCEMLLFSLALADRIKIINEDNIKSHKDNELLIRKINRELEDKVIERTKLFEDKNRELDSFLYQSSHDIKGPVKSIIGLSMIGLIDVEGKIAQDYFTRLLECSKQLDQVNSNLLSLMDFKHLQIYAQKIIFKDLVLEIMQPFEVNPDFSFIRKEIQIQQTENFYCDSAILKIILKDMIQTSLLFADKDLPESILIIKVKVEKKGANIHLYGSGKGISPKAIEEMFNPFSSLQYRSEQKIMGLYLLRMYIEKVNGKLEFSSIVNQHLTFDIYLESLL